jgi:hypothetical protein
MILAAVSATVLLFAGVWLVLVVATGFAAHARGRDAFGWALLALLISPFLALLLLIAFPSRPHGGTRTCPQCAEQVARRAVVCRYCGIDLPAYRPPIPRPVAIVIIIAALIGIGIVSEKFTTQPTATSATSTAKSERPTSMVVREIDPAPAQPAQQSPTGLDYRSSYSFADQPAERVPVPRPRPRP